MLIVVLCNSFDDAEESFAKFMDFLETYEHLSIFKVFEYSYCVETDDNIKYIFVDYRFENLFIAFENVDILYSDEFFDGIDEYYTFVTDNY